MSKRFYDIIPPDGGLEKKASLELGSESGSGKSGGRKHFSFNWNLIWVVIVLLLGVAFLASFMLRKAEIEIYPQTKLVDLEQELIIGQGKTFPVQVLSKKMSLTKDFSATGQAQVNKKAQGTITIYNEYSSHPLTFVAHTRFVSAQGKLFRSQKKVTIPGQTIEQGQKVPGTVEIKVKAAEPGKDYNIGPTTFSIPGLLGSEMYTSVYAKSSSSMKGGFEGKSSQVTEGDLQKAQNELKQKLMKKIGKALKQESQQKSLSFKKSMFVQEILSRSCSAEPEDPVESFSCEIKGEMKGLVFKEQDLKNWAEKLILKQVPEDRKIKPDSLQFSVTVQEKDLEKKQAKLTVSVLAKVFSPLNQKALIKRLAGKSRATARIFLKTHPKIKKAEISLSPFWISSVPQDFERIELEVMW